MKKTYILDTNVLLTDANAMFSFEENNVILPFTVLEELDRHKDRQDEVGRNARETARKLGLLVKEKKDQSLIKGISLGDGKGLLKILSMEEALGKEKVEFPSELEEFNTGDNRIIKFCLSYEKHNHKALKDKEKVILVTRDILLQTKSSALGIEVQDYKKFNIAEKSESLYSGVTTINNFDIDEFFKNESEKQPTFLTEEQSVGLFPNQFLVLKNGSQSALVRYLGPEIPLKKINEKKKLGKFIAKNKEQDFAVDLLMDPNVKLVTMTGKAGGGKTLTALAAGLEQVIGNGGKESGARYKSLLVTRPIQPMGKDIGFLPGSLEEKMEPWIAPIKDNLRFLITEGKKGKFNDQILNEYFDQGIIEVEAMTFIRGRSIADAVIIVDEAQNLTVHELKTILTRVGENTKIVLLGDVEQIDNMYLDSVSNGLSVAIEKFKSQSIAGHVTLIKGERSELATISANIL